MSNVVIQKINLYDLDLNCSSDDESKEKPSRSPHREVVDISSFINLDELEKQSAPNTAPEEVKTLNVSNFSTSSNVPMSEKAPRKTRIVRLSCQSVSGIKTKISECEADESDITFLDTEKIHQQLIDRITKSGPKNSPNLKDNGRKSESPGPNLSTSVVNSSREENEQIFDKIGKSSSSKNRNCKVGLNLDLSGKNSSQLGSSSSSRSKSIKSGPKSSSGPDLNISGQNSTKTGQKSSSPGPNPPQGLKSDSNHKKSTIAGPNSSPSVLSPKEFAIGKKSLTNPLSPNMKIYKGPRPTISIPLDANIKIYTNTDLKELLEPSSTNITIKQETMDVDEDQPVIKQTWQQPEVDIKKELDEFESLDREDAAMHDQSGTLNDQTTEKEEVVAESEDVQPLEKRQKIASPENVIRIQPGPGEAGKATNPVRLSNKIRIGGKYLDIRDFASINGQRILKQGNKTFRILDSWKMAKDNVDVNVKKPAYVKISAEQIAGSVKIGQISITKVPQNNPDGDEQEADGATENAENFSEIEIKEEKIDGHDPVSPDPPAPSKTTTSAIKIKHIFCNSVNSSSRFASPVTSPSTNQPKVTSYPPKLIEATKTAALGTDDFQHVKIKDEKLDDEYESITIEKESLGAPSKPVTKPPVVSTVALADEIVSTKVVSLPPSSTPKPRRIIVIKKPNGGNFNAGTQRISFADFEKLQSGSVVRKVIRAVPSSQSGLQTGMRYVIKKPMAEGEKSTQTGAGTPNKPTSSIYDSSQLLKKEESTAGYTTVMFPKTNTKIVVNKQAVPGRQSSPLFRCQKCQILFSSADEYALHVQDHKAGHIYEQKQAMSLDQVSQLNQFKCSMCTAAFPTAEKLSTHENRHKTEFICKFCGKQFMLHSRYKEHLLLHERRDKYIECKQCDKRFLKQERFDEHMAVHMPREVFACNMCDRSYGSSQALLDHQKSHVKKLTMKCGLCNYETFIKQNFEKHANMHMRYVEKIVTKTFFKCDSCPQSFREVAVLEMHKNHMHHDG